VVEKEVELGEFERTGIEIDSVLTRQILINIFEKNTPLHDGAVILRGNRIAAATCYLPLSDNLALSKDLGTRHRAAVGVSEVSDSLTIVVSEETGSVSLAVEGRIYRDIDEKFLKEQLMNARGITEEPGKFIDWKKRLKNVKKVKRSSD
jgi:diadenylate cyclase